MAEQGDVCPECGEAFAGDYKTWLKVDTLCGMSEEWNEDGQHEDCVNACLYRARERLKAKLAAAMKVVEAADKLIRFLPTENDAAMDAADAYDTERAKLRELP